MKTRAYLFVLMLAALLVLTLSACGTTPSPPGPEAEAALAVHPDNLSYSNKWRIEVSEGARSDGEIVFQINPRDGDSQRVTVPIESSYGENRVAREIRDRLREQLDPERYHVERDDGEDVLVKKRHGEENFALRVISSTVKAVRIRVQKE